MSADWVNPIVVKELRQAVQGRFVAAVLTLILGVELMPAVLAITATRPAGVTYEAGAQVFSGMYGILLAVCLILIPSYAAVRLSGERSGAHADLLFVTALSARSIIAGKFLSGLVLVALLHAACLPFLTLTYFLRGIDLPTIFTILAFGFFVVMIALQGAILLAVLPCSRALQLFLGAIALMVMGVLYISTMTASFMFVSSGVGSLLASPQFWYPAAAFLIGGATVGLLLFTLSVALIQPASANRSLQVRLVMTGLWGVTGALAFLLQSRAGGSIMPVSRLLPGASSGGVWVVWSAASVASFSVALLLAVGERESWGPRVSRAIPRQPARRLAAFLFYSGAGGGVLWAAAMIVLTVLARLLAATATGVTQSVLPLAGLGLYAWNYALTAVHLRRWFLSRRLQPSLTGIFAFALVAAGSTLPFLIGYFLFYDSWGAWQERPWLFGNPFALEVESHRGTYLLFAATWAAVAGVLALPWFGAQFRRFSPPAAAASQWTTNTAGA